MKKRTKMEYNEEVERREGIWDKDEIEMIKRGGKWCGELTGEIVMLLE